jgi:uncharacterized protein (TIGR02145 family)
MAHKLENIVKIFSKLDDWIQGLNFHPSNRSIFMKTTKRFLMAASVSLALAFTLGCSSDGEGETGPSSDSGSGAAVSSSGGGTSGSSSSAGGKSSSSAVNVGSCDIKDYKTVTIGTQVWMAENFNCDKGENVCYDREAENCETYGRLYDWETALTICPSGWHLPSKDEWIVLADYAGGPSIGGTKLKATSWQSTQNYPEAPAGTDAFGFTALPGGEYFVDSNKGTKYFSGLGIEGDWWSSTKTTNTMVIDVSLKGNGEEMGGLIIGGATFAGRYNSIRCLQDGAPEPSYSSASVKVVKKTLSDSRDGKAYETAVIGTQEWMAENLNYNVSGSKCYGEGDRAEDYDGKIIILSESEIQANCDEYGRLYDWSTALTVCPSGWHLPSNDEWKTLVEYVGIYAGTKLKAESGWYKLSSTGADRNGTDIYGFAALPGGFCCESSIFRRVGRSGYWWAADERINPTNGNAGNSAYEWIIQGFETYVSKETELKSVGFLSVRCVKD